MGTLLRRVAAGCATVAVIGAGFAVSSASGLDKKCWLSPKMTIIGGSHAAGSVGYRLTISNPDSWSCRIGRHPFLKLIGENGDFLPTSRVKVGPQGYLVIPAGGAVSARLRFSPDIPGPGEPTQGPCEPQATEIRVRTPWGYRAGPIHPRTSVCDHGKIEEGALS